MHEGLDTMVLSFPSTLSFLAAICFATALVLRGTQASTFLVIAGTALATIVVVIHLVATWRDGHSV